MALTQSFLLLHHCVSSCLPDLSNSTCHRHLKSNLSKPRFLISLSSSGSLNISSLSKLEHHLPICSSRRSGFLFLPQSSHLIIIIFLLVGITIRLKFKILHVVPACGSLPHKAPLTFCLPAILTFRVPKGAWLLPAPVLGACCPFFLTLLLGSFPLILQVLAQPFICSQSIPYFSFMAPILVVISKVFVLLFCSTSVSSA